MLRASNKVLAKYRNILNDMQGTLSPWNTVFLVHVCNQSIFKSIDNYGMGMFHRWLIAASQNLPLTLLLSISHYKSIEKVSSRSYYKKEPHSKKSQYSPFVKVHVSSHLLPLLAFEGQCGSDPSCLLGSLWIENPCTSSHSEKGRGF